MAEDRTPDQVRTGIVMPLVSITGDLIKVCDEWEQAIQEGVIKRPDLLINEKMAITAIRTRIPALVNEIRQKLAQAKCGVYRYRESVSKTNRKKRKSNN